MIHDSKKPKKVINKLQIRNANNAPIPDLKKTLHEFQVKINPRMEKHSNYKSSTTHQKLQSKISIEPGKHARYVMFTVSLKTQLTGST